MTKLARVERSPEQILAEHLVSWEDHVAAWIDRREAVSKSQFVMGLIASSVDTHYGEKSLSDFAKAVGEGASTIFRYRTVYRRWFEFSQRCENLCWSHYLMITESQLDESDGEALLNKASEDGWTVRQLKRELGARAIKTELAEEVPHLDPQMAAAISHWRELKSAVERFATSNPQFCLYAEDFIGDVDEAIDEPWDSARAFIDRLIFAGCREVEALAHASHWRKGTCQRLCDELTAIGTHEWRDQGGKTEDARGAVRRLIVPVEEPSGESYQGSRFGLVVGEEEE